MVSLSLLTQDDLEFLLEIRNDCSTRLQLENDRIFTLDECKIWFENLRSPWYIIKNDVGERVGYFRTNSREIGCDIHPNHRRKGYARASYNLYLKQVQHASLWVFKTNHARLLYESLGFKLSGNKKFVRGREYVEMLFNAPS
jgi:RimJ/RimL family protein N-acetyltransferase